METRIFRRRYSNNTIIEQIAYKNIIECAEQNVSYKSHMVELAFAITYHKLQGQTLQKVILDINMRPNSLKRLDFYSFYVGMTRVEYADNIRILPCQDDNRFSHLKKLKTSVNLKKWLENIKKI